MTTTINLGLLEPVVQNVFDGDIYSTTIDNIDKVFLNNRDKFTDSGIASFFKSCQIPSPKFFLEQPIDYIRDTFVNQKSKLRDKGSLLLLVRGDSIVYSSVNNPNVNQENPQDKLNLHNDWLEVGEDLLKGYKRYVYTPKDIKPDDFHSTVFMNVPIFYNGKLSLEIGLFRLICTNGLVTHIDSKQLKLPQETFSNHEIYEPLLSSVISALTQKADSYNQFLKYLENKEVPSFDRLREQIKMLEEDKIISKQISLQSQTHLDILETKKEVSDITYPNSMSNLMDFTNLLTRVAQESKTLTQQVKFVFIVICFNSL